jgi:hypothetical protein
MEQDSQQYAYSQDTQKIRDIEERTRLLKERSLLLSQSFIENRDKTFKELQELKKSLTLLKEENIKMKEMIKGLLEQADRYAKKAELETIKNQLDMLRG